MQPKLPCISITLGDTISLFSQLSVSFDGRNNTRFSSQSYKLPTYSLWHNRSLFEDICSKIIVEKTVLEDFTKNLTSKLQGNVRTV